MSSQRKTRRQPTTVSYSSLEAREVLTALLPVSFDLNTTTNELVIRADPHSMETVITVEQGPANTIVVSEELPPVNVADFNVTSFPAASIDTIRYVGSISGIDNVSIDVAVDTLLSGRGGDDVLSVVADSNHTAILYGGSGSDTLTANAGDVRLFGGDDFDRLTSLGVGDTLIFGGGSGDNITTSG